MPLPIAHFHPTITSNGPSTHTNTKDAGVDGGGDTDGREGKKNGILSRLTLVMEVFIFNASATALAPSAPIPFPAQMHSIWIDCRGLKSAR